MNENAEPWPSSLVTDTVPVMFSSVVSTGCSIEYGRHGNLERGELCFYLRPRLRIPRCTRGGKRFLKILSRIHCVTCIPVVRAEAIEE